MSYQTMLFDFDGVLSRGRFYTKTLLPDHPDVYEWIQKNIFGDKKLVRNWMRNRVDSAYINSLIARNTGIGYKVLHELYIESIRRMELEKEVTDLAGSLRSSGRKIGIVTDNMDVFTEIITPSHQLDKLFDVVINSADHGILKKDKNGELFDIALAALGERIENSLMIDDSEKTIELYEQKGGRGYIYKNFVDLRSFLQMDRK